MKKAKKSNSKKCFRIGIRFSPDRLEFIKGLREEFGLSSTGFFTMGVRYVLGLKKDIINKIYLKDYVVLYHGSRFPHKVRLKKKRSNIKYITMYTYHIERVSDKRVRFFYKENDDTEDMNFLIKSIGIQHVDEEVLEMFPMDLWEQIPGE